MADPRLQVPPAICRELARRIRRAAPRAGNARGRLTTLVVRLVGEAEMTQLHEQYYRESGSTDVLSFGSEDPRELGDIALGWQAVCDQAADRGVSPLESASVLAIHGLAHLLGHDHRTRREARSMLRAERRALRAIGSTDITRPYG